MSKLRKWPSTILKYGTLISLKESYLFVRNSLGLIEHPFKTFRAIFREEDRSQMLLIFGLPAYLLIGGLGVIWMGRRLISAPPGDWGFWTKSGLMAVFLLTLAAFLYLGYWLWRVWRVGRRQ